MSMATIFGAQPSNRPSEIWAIVSPTSPPAADIDQGWLGPMCHSSTKRSYGKILPIGKTTSGANNAMIGEIPVESKPCHRDGESFTPILALTGLGLAPARLGGSAPHNALRPMSSG